MLVQDTTKYGMPARSQGTPDLYCYALAGSSTVFRKTEPAFLTIFQGDNIKRTGSAIWSGGIKDGKGTLTTESETLSKTPYSFSARFKNAAGTNPEELIAAAHAGCFTMDLSGRLEARGMTAEEIRTTATLEIGRTEKGFSITHIHLDVHARIPDGDADIFRTEAFHAKENCPVSRVLDTDISVETTLDMI